MILYCLLSNWNEPIVAPFNIIQVYQQPWWRDVLYERLTNLWQCGRGKDNGGLWQLVSYLFVCILFCDLPHSISSIVDEGAAHERREISFKAFSNPIALPCCAIEIMLGVLLNAIGT